MNLALLADRELAERGVCDRLWFEERSYTNAELHDASCRLASALGALGIEADDRVVVLVANCPEVLISYPAIWRAGAVAVPVLFMLEAHELAYILQNSGAKAIITSPELLDKVRAAQGELSLHVIAITENKHEIPQDVLSFESLVERAEPLREAVLRAPEDLAVVLYTSGTTGKPKGVMQSHANLLANAQNAWDSAKQREPEITLLVLPLAHTFGLSVVVAGYFFDSYAILLRKFAPDAVLKLIERHRATVMSGVPTMFAYMLITPGEFDVSSMKRWIVGAAPMPAEQLRKFEERFGGRMLVGYGLTEASPTIAVEREEDPRKPGSTGRAVEGVRVKIVDEQRVELPTGEVGEIAAAGANITLGYLGMPEATAECFQDGWLYTGDMGYLDPDGFLFVVERKKDLIIRGGFNVYPKDVEEVLYRHPAVAECAVVGVPDTLLGEQVCACVVLRPGVEVTAEALIAHCQASMAKFKTPRYVEFLSALPKTPIGKTQKKELRKWASEKLADQLR